MPKCNVILHLGIYVNTEEKTVSMDVFRRDLYNKAMAPAKRAATERNG